MDIFDKGVYRTTEANGQVYVWHLLHKAWSSKGGKPLVAFLTRCRLKGSMEPKTWLYTTSWGPQES